MYLDENLPSERLNAPPLDASACKEEHKHYIRQVELVHGLPGYFSRSAQMRQKDVGAGGIHPLAGATGSMLAAREVGLHHCSKVGMHTHTRQVVLLPPLSGEVKALQHFHARVCARSGTCQMWDRNSATTDRHVCRQCKTM